MGIIRSGLLTIVSILLFLSILSMNSFMTVSMSLDYDVLKPELTSVVQDLVQEQVSSEDIDKNLTTLAKSFLEYDIKVSNDGSQKNVENKIETSIKGRSLYV